jgi:cell division protein FtsI (penicillin-binding protein 3)
MDWDRPRVRLLLLAGFGILWLTVTLARLAYLELFRYDDYLRRAEKQQQRIVNVSPRRGSIYDRNLHELAMSVMVDSCFAVPSEVSDHDLAGRLLSRVLNLPAQEITARLDASQNFAWIARKITPQQAARVRGMNLKGIYFVKEPKRFYPKGSLAAEALGWTDVDEKGGGGIESELDSQIRGQPGRMLVLTDARHRWFEGREQSATAGAKVVLTIDETIQYIVERELGQAIAETHARSGSIIVEDPSSGEIMGLASWPTFNPNAPGDVSADARMDRAIGAIYEPGSVFKIVTISGALDSGSTSPDEVVDCQMGSIYIAGHRIRDHKPFGLLTVRQILAKSSDVGAIKLGLRLGAPKFYEYIRAFGFGATTGIDLPGEQRGLLRPVESWSPISIGAISMGQEVGVTAIQLVSAMNAIANGGVWVRPHIVRSVSSNAPSISSLTAVRAAGASDARRVISPSTAATMRAMLEGVVLAGTAPKARLVGYTVAGKTGTAQKLDPATGRYSATQYVASFVGFAPINNPAVTILVTLDSPVGLHQGGEVSAPVFQRIAEQVLAYLNVPQDQQVLPRVERASYLAAGQADDSDVSDLDPAQTDSTSEPEGPVAAPVTAQDQPAPTMSLSAGDGVVVPTLTSQSVRQAVLELEKAGLSPVLVGSGIALEQSPAAGTTVRKGTRVAVEFGAAAKTAASSARAKRNAGSGLSHTRRLATPQRRQPTVHGNVPGLP